MLPLRFACLSHSIMTKQVKMLNHLYGAACDHQYMLTAMPTYSKQTPIVRRVDDEPLEWQKIDLGRFQNFTTAVINMPVDGARRKRGRRRRHSKQSGDRSRSRSRSRLPVFETSVVDLDGNERLHHKQDGAGICEECGGPLHLPRAPNKRKQKDIRKETTRDIPGVGAHESQGKPDFTPGLANSLRSSSGNRSPNG